MVGLLKSIHHIHQTLHQVISTFFFSSLQNALNDETFQEDQLITYVENFLYSKSAEFYLWRINKIPDK